MKQTPSSPSTTGTTSRSSGICSRWGPHLGIRSWGWLSSGARCPGIETILISESGVSLAATGWRLIGERGGGSWSVPSRPRVDKHPTQAKLLFERTAKGKKRDEMP